ncbi:hypothetical protein NBRC10512_004766 [Rhodotorula toruloides]
MPRRTLRGRSTATLSVGRGIERCPVPNFEMPATIDPTSFLQLHTDDASDPSCRIKSNHGATTLAFEFQGGIVVAVDSRATAGSYIASGTVKKLIEINPYLLRTMAGGAAIPADVSRLPVLRVAQSQADLGRGNKQGPRLLAQLPKRVIVSISYTRTRRFANLHR